MITASKIILPIALATALAGCASTPSHKAEAIARARPFMNALNAYHQKFGDYPRELDDLRPRYVGRDVPVYNHADPKQAWFLFYERVNRDSYKLFVDSNPCSQAVFSNGNFFAGYGHNYR